MAYTQVRRWQEQVEIGPWHNTDYVTVDRSTAYIVFDDAAERKQFHQMILELKPWAQAHIDKKIQQEGERLMTLHCRWYTNAMLAYDQYRRELERYEAKCRNGHRWLNWLLTKPEPMEKPLEPTFQMLDEQASMVVKDSFHLWIVKVPGEYVKWLDEVTPDQYKRVCWRVNQPGSE